MTRRRPSRAGVTASSTQLSSARRALRGSRSLRRSSRSSSSSPTSSPGRVSVARLDFFTKLPKPVGETGGGMANAIVGTLHAHRLCAGAVGIPVGLHRRRLPGRVRPTSRSRLRGPVHRRRAERRAVDRHRHLRLRPGRAPDQALLGARRRLALGIMMIPIIARTTEELLARAPTRCARPRSRSARPQWRDVVRGRGSGRRCRASSPASCSPLARVAGETAPLLFTAFNNRFWIDELDQPIASLPVRSSPTPSRPTTTGTGRRGPAALVLVIAGPRSATSSPDASRRCTAHEVERPRSARVASRRRAAMRDASSAARAHARRAGQDARRRPERLLRRQPGAQGHLARRSRRSR